MKTTNPYGHPFPHAKLKNVKLTLITRLSKATEGLSRHLIGNDDVRNFAVSRADDVAKQYGWRMQYWSGPGPMPALSHSIIAITEQKQ